MNILLLICTGLLAIIPIIVIIHSNRKKEKIKKSDIIISTLGIIAFILTQFIANQQERKTEAQRQEYNLEIAKINQTISEEKHNTEIAKKEIVFLQKLKKQNYKPD